MLSFNGGLFLAIRQVAAPLHMSLRKLWAKLGAVFLDGWRKAERDCGGYRTSRMCGSEISHSFVFLNLDLKLFLFTQAFTKH